MPNQNLTDLTARTTTADTDLIHVNSGGTDYKETKANFLSDIKTTLTSVNNTVTSGTIGNQKLADDITSLNSSLSKFKSASKTGSTDSAGTLNLVNGKRLITSAIAEGYICIPFYYSNGNTYVKVLNTSMNPVVNTSVTVEYTYIE